MGRLLSQLLTLAVIAAVIGFVGAPYWSFFALRSAAKSTDAEALADLVDYDKTRNSLRDQVGASRGPVGPPPSVWQDPLGALRRSLEPMGPAPQADNYLSPHALAALTDGEGRAAKDARAADLTPSDSKVVGPPYPVFRYWGVNRTRLAVKDEDNGETIFTFERRGLFKWKLVHIGLPDLDDHTTVAPADAAPEKK